MLVKGGPSDSRSKGTCSNCVHIVFPEHSGATPYKVRDEITCRFPNFNSDSIEVWEWMNNLISHFTGHVTTYP